MGYKRTLKGIRNLKGFTQKEMANLMNIPPSTYAKKENEESKFYVEEALLLAKLLDTKIEEIFYI